MDAGLKKLYLYRREVLFLCFFTKLKILLEKLLHFIFLHDILITVADAETQKTTKKKLKNLVDIEK
ncbi:hypothetical protein ABH955_005528 [Bacillus sp. RC240]